MYASPQQDYEKYLHFVSEEKERMMLRSIEHDVKEKMSERNDYQSYYYKPAMGKYTRISKETVDFMDKIQGE